MKHLVFYDGNCGMCDHIVQFLLKADTTKIFAFAPLQGTTAKEMLKNLPSNVVEADSLILIEDYQSENPVIHIYGKGAFRIAWLLGGGWALVGWISFLPPILYDWGYRLVARNRHKFFGKTVCDLPERSNIDRFLP